MAQTQLETPAGAQAKADAAAAAAAAGRQLADPDLTALANLSPTDNDVLQRKVGSWTNRTPAQFRADLGLATVATTGAYIDLSGKPTIPATYGDLTGTVPQSALPAIALTEYLGAVVSQAAMLALTGQRGDWCTRTDLGTDWQLIAELPSLLASWREMTYPASPVSSVNGRVGAVTGLAEAASVDALGAVREAGISTVIYCAPTGSDANPGLISSAPKQTLAAALSALPSTGGTVRLAADAAFMMGASDSFILDAFKVSIVGDNTTLTWSAAPTAGYAIRIISTATYTNRYNNWRRVLDGVILRGNLGTPLAGIGLQIGEAGGNVEISNFVCENGGVEGFATCMDYQHNAWRTHFQDFHFRNGSTASIRVPVSLSNFGECMTFNRSMIEGEVLIESGEFHFISCSFDNAPVTVGGDGKVYCTASHFENPLPATLKRFGSVTGASSALFISNCEILINGLSNGSDWTLALFHADATATVRGLIISNVNIPQTSKYHPESGTDAIRALVAGTGRVQVRGICMNNNFNAYPIALGCNGLYNANSEVGTTSGWTVTGTAAASLFTVDTVNKRSGTSSFKMAPGLGLNLNVTQKVPCRPGDWALCSLWVDVVRGAGSTANHKLTFTTVDGVSLGDINFSNESTSTAGFVLKNKGGVAPPGTAFVALHVFAASGTADLTVVQFDDVILTVS